MHLPDVNFWVALNFESHEHHASAKTWMQSAAEDTCCMCRLTQLGFLRLSTNRKIFPLDALRLNEAWRVYDELLTDHRVVFVEEPDNIEVAWRSFSQHRSYSPKVWNDAYLAAFAKCAGFEIVSFDTGLTQYQGVPCTILSLAAQSILLLRMNDAGPARPGLAITVISCPASQSA